MWVLVLDGAHVWELAYGLGFVTSCVVLVGGLGLAVCVGMSLGWCEPACFEQKASVLCIWCRPDAAIDGVLGHIWQVIHRCC